MGAPHRLKYFGEIFERIRRQEDVVFWTGEQILDWYRGHVSPTPYAGRGLG
jgi:hypothetical protein